MNDRQEFHAKLCELRAETRQLKRRLEEIKRQAAREGRLKNGDEDTDLPPPRLGDRRAW